jgi:molybdopterin-containing oxidoreductase family iron-sulfur binding subunit
MPGARVIPIHREAGAVAGPRDGPDAREERGAYDPPGERVEPDGGEAPQAAAMRPALSRRRALQLMAASAALAGAGCSRPPAQRIHPYVDMPEAGRHGEPIHYASACLREGHAQGVLVGTREGRPIKIEGNPSHPSSRGATDPLAQAAVLQLWDPDRAQAVWQRLDAGGRDGGDGRRGAARGPQRDERPAGDGGAARPAAAPSSWAAFEAAWRTRMNRLDREAGEGLRVLTPAFSSPTLHAQLAALLGRWPRARWHRHDPLAPAHAEAGAQLAFGRALRPVWHFDRARFVMALDADPFSHGPGCVRDARDWAGLRAASGGTLPRLMAAETAPGLLGVRADARLAAAPPAIEALLWRVAARLHPDLPAPAVDLAPADAATAAFEARAEALLRRHGADSLIVAGEALSPPTQALVLLLNQRLGAFGRTLDAIAPTTGEDAGTLEALVEAMRAGAVHTLLVLGGNPAYDAPGASGFADALARVPFSVRLGLYRDETGVRCAWQLPASHELEQWGDALAHDGSLTPIQPAIAPLYDSRSAHELLALLAGERERDGHALLRRHWRARGAGGGDFEAFWRESLAHGVVEGSASAPLPLPAARVPAPPAPIALREGELQAVFVPDASVLDGSLANNGWLQELPRPFSKIAWDNALHLGPATAAALGLASGDRVRASAGAAAVEAPVWVQAGHAEGAASLPLGYGRSAAGRVGNGVGFDAYRLRGANGAAVALRLAPTGRRHDFARTQHEHDPHGRRPARTVRPGERLAASEAPAASLYPPRARGEHAWAMAIDLDACIGCNACMVACQAENNIPVVGREEVARGRAMHWLRVDRYDDEETGSLFQPVPCMHCENAPCELVCPVGATVHDSEGLNVQVYNRCIGTRFCSNNCPYKVRRFNFLQVVDAETESLKALRNPDVTVRARGVMEKCSYCVQRLARARHHAERSGRAPRDGDVLTACQAVCPTQAIRFGDLSDPESDVRRAKASPRHYALLGELNTRPRTTYLARVVPARPHAG